MSGGKIVMRFLTIWRLAAILLLVTGSFILPAPDDAASAAVVAQDDDDEEGGKDDNSGNDQDDGDDDDGNRGKNKDKDQNDNKGKEKGKDKDKGKKADDVTATAPYTVDVACTPIDDGSQTECIFTGIAPPDAKDVGHVDLPASAVCAEVIDGDYEYVDPDPNTRVTGYKSRGSQGTFTLVLEGNVTTGDTTTYWIKAGPGVFPASGPGLICDEPAAAEQPQAQATFEPTATPAPTTGEIMVVTYICTDVPADTSTFDWFGACEPGEEIRQFTLAATDTPDDHLTAATNEAGEVTFGDLAPGTYLLENVDTPWCHANSDNVTPEGQVTVETGQRTTVWTFHCSGDEPLK